MQTIIAYLYLVFIGLMSYYVTGVFIFLLELVFPPIIIIIIILSMMFFPWFWGKALISSYGYVLSHVLIPTLRVLHSIYLWVKAPVYQPQLTLALEV